MAIIVSNGFNRFHMAVAAASLAQAGELSLFVTGTYPTPRLIRAAESVYPAVADKLRRRREAVPNELIRSLWLPEFPHFFAHALERRFGPSGMTQHLQAFGMRLYGLAACNAVREGAVRGARTYHFRAGYGGASLAEARKRGLVTICDHSIVHPALLDYLVGNGGAFPDAPMPPSADPFWQTVQRDIDEADIVLVNSDFVRETFAFQKFDMSKVHVIYLGVDNQFLENVPERTTGPSDGPLKLLFAGGFGPRKGAADLLDALAGLSGLDWQLSIAGNIDAGIRSEYAAQLADPRIIELGWIDRSQLSAAMSQSDIFVFPSLAEGSARVIFEAMACGCYIITTPNSGSIVENDVNGALVSPGTPQGIVDAVTKAQSDRTKIREIGIRNAELVRARYGQHHYGHQLGALYASLSTSITQR